MKFFSYTSFHPLTSVVRSARHSLSFCCSRFTSGLIAAAGHFWSSSITWAPCAPYSRLIARMCIAESPCFSGIRCSRRSRRFSDSGFVASSAWTGSSALRHAMFVSIDVSSSKRSSSARKIASSYWFLRICLKLRSSEPDATDTHESLSTSCSSGPRPEHVGFW